MLRYVVHSPFQTVTVDDEIAYTLDYLSLQKQNYEDHLNYSITIAPSVRSVPLPRLVIQPFVENSIHNGFRKKLPPWDISIACESIEGRWHITISDNGCGIEEGIVQDLLRRIALEQTESAYAESLEEQGIDGIAINNTYNRLRLMYGSKLGFTICSNETGGTTIRISGPMDQSTTR
jgi:two-component system sensor histidine kinase YesM